MYRQIYRDKLLYYRATQRFNFQKTLQQNPKSQIRRPYPGGTNTLKIVKVGDIIR